MKAYIYGLIDSRDNQIHYIGHTVDMMTRRGGHMMDHADTPKTRWIADVVHDGGSVEVIQLAEVPYVERFSHEYKWIYLGRAMGWPLTNTVAMKTEAYTHLMDGLGSTLVVEVDKGLTWRRVSNNAYPVGVLFVGLGGISGIVANLTGSESAVWVSSVALLLAIGLATIHKFNTNGVHA